MTVSFLCELLRRGSDAGVDEAIHYYPAIEAFLAQAKVDRTDLAAGYAALVEILGMAAPGAEEKPKVVK